MSDKSSLTISNFSPDSMEQIGHTLIQTAKRMREGRASFISGGAMLSPDATLSRITLMADLVVEFHDIKQ